MIVIFFSVLIPPRCVIRHTSTSSLQIFFPTYGSIKPHATIGQIDGMITDLGVFQMICSSAVEGGSDRKE